MNRTTAFNRINRQPAQFGNKSHIALQKAKEAGVTNLKPIAKANPDWQHGFVQWSIYFVCSSPDCRHLVQDQLYCSYCQAEYYIDSLGRIYELPERKEE